MDEILALQQQLADVQRTTTSQRLSERNCVELVMKLQSLNLIELIFTRSGKEYLTPKQLTQELEDELLTRAGRVNLTDLPDALNISLSHIEAALPNITADPSVRIIRGELIADYYLESLVEELNDSLAASDVGTDSLADIATRYALPVDLLRTTLSEAGDRLNAHFDATSGVLTSDAAVERHRAEARGVLRATTSPANVTDLAALVDIPHETLLSVAEELLSSGVIDGVIEGRAARAVFVPAVFKTAAAQVLVDDFSANGFVRLESFKHMHITDVDAFIAEHLSGAVVLDACIVQPVLLDTLSTSAAEAVAAGSWLDLVASLPVGFPERDVNDFVDQIAKNVESQRADVDGEGGNERKKTSTGGKGKRRGKGSSTAKESKSKSTTLFAHQFIVSTETSKKFEELITKNAIDKAEERAKEMAEKMETIGGQAGTSKAEQDDSEKESGKKKGKGRRRGGGKEKGNKGSNTAAGEGNSVSSQFPVAVPSVEEAVEFALEDEDCSKVVESDYLDQSSEGVEMLTNVLETIFGEVGLHDLYNTKASEAVETLERERVLARKNAEKALLTGLHNAELFARMANSLPDEDLTASSLSWLIDSICVDILCRVLDAAAQSTGVLLAGASRAHELPGKREKIDFVRSACEQLAPTVASKLRELIATVAVKEGGSVEQFLEEYDGAVTMLDLPERRPIEKKAERASLSTMRAELAASLDDETLSDRKAFKTAVVLTYARSSGGCIVEVNEEDVHKLCLSVEKNAKPEEAGVALADLRASFSAGEEGAADSEGLSPGFAEKLAVLREHIG